MKNLWQATRKALLSLGHLKDDIYLALKHAEAVKKKKKKKKFKNCIITQDIANKDLSKPRPVEGTSPTVLYIRPDLQGLVYTQLKKHLKLLGYKTVLGHLLQIRYEIMKHI